MFKKNHLDTLKTLKNAFDNVHLTYYHGHVKKKKNWRNKMYINTPCSYCLTSKSLDPRANWKMSKKKVEKNAPRIIPDGWSLSKNGKKVKIPLNQSSSTGTSVPFAELRFRRPAWTSEKPFSRRRTERPRREEVGENSRHLFGRPSRRGDNPERTRKTIRVSPRRQQRLMAFRPHGGGGGGGGATRRGVYKQWTRTVLRRRPRARMPVPREEVSYVVAYTLQRRR